MPMPMPENGEIEKVVTEEEIKSGRFSVRAGVRDTVFRHLPGNNQPTLTMVDEKGHSYDVVLNFRENRKKVAFKSKGGKIFARKRLSVHDSLVISEGDSPVSFNVQVRKWLRLAPPNTPHPIASSSSSGAGAGAGAGPSASVDKDWGEGLRLSLI